MRSALLLAMCACRHPAAAKDDAPVAATPRDAPASDAAIADATADASVDAGSAIPPGPTHVTLTIDGDPSELRYGYADPTSEDLMIGLFAGPIDCATHSPIGPGGDHAGAHVLLNVPPGPGGSFYAGHPFGLQVVVEAPGNLQKVANLPPLPTTLAISPPSIAIAIEPTTWKKGARVKGTLDGAEAMLIGESAVKGSFDVELCDDLSPELTRLRASAPDGPARGTRGGKPLVARSVLAIVRHRPSSRDEAVYVAAGRVAGSLRQVWLLEFYDQPNVPCPPKDQDWAPGRRPFLRVQGPGGAGAEHPLLHAPQPGHTVLLGGDDDFGDIWPAWVRFDDLAFTTGAKIHGALWTQSTPLYDVKGTFGGSFAATVCDVAE